MKIEKQISRPFEGEQGIDDLLLNKAEISWSDCIFAGWLDYYNRTMKTAYDIGKSNEVGLKAATKFFGKAYTNIERIQVVSAVSYLALGFALGYVASKLVN